MNSVNDDDDDDDDDVWGAFGSDSDSDSDDDDDDDDDNCAGGRGGVDDQEKQNGSNNNNVKEEGEEQKQHNEHKEEEDAAAAAAIKMSSSISLYLSQTFLKHNSQIKLSNRHVLILSLTTTLVTTTTSPTSSALVTHSTLKSLHQRGMNVEVISKQLALTSRRGGGGGDDVQVQDEVDGLKPQQQQQQQQDQAPLSANSMFDAVIIFVEDTHHDSRHHFLEDYKDDIATLIQTIAIHNLCPGGKLLVPQNIIIIKYCAMGDNDDDEDDDDDSSISNSKNEVARILDEEFVVDDLHDVVYKPKPTKDLKNKNKNNSNSNSNRNRNITIIALTKKVCKAHTTMCRWLESKFQTRTSIQQEEDRLAEATVALSVHEMATATPTATTNHNRMTMNSIRHASLKLQQFGYCVLPRLLPPTQCIEYRQAVLKDVHLASSKLKTQHQVDIYNPWTATGTATETTTGQEEKEEDDDEKVLQRSSSTSAAASEPQSYRELSMREDLRLDLRHGPALRKLRTKQQRQQQQQKQNLDATNNNVNDVDQPVVVTALDYRFDDNNDLNEDGNKDNGPFLQSHRGLLEIVRRTMNPHCDPDGTQRGDKNNDTELWKGNIGRYNFNGRGADGSYQDLRVSCVGGIVSFPGSADQALHADTPHLFEHIPNLPAHYINIFASCQPFHDKVGGTAFIHGSHDLRFTTRYCSGGADANDNSRVYPFLVRPQLNIGDVILFDCRILHFGMSNGSDSGIERCLCYANTTMHWFQDPKNWELNRCIFSESDYEDVVDSQDNCKGTLEVASESDTTTTKKILTPKGCDTFVAFCPERVIFGKNSDRPAGEVQTIKRYPATTWFDDNNDDSEKDSRTLQCTYISIPQVKDTHAILISQIDWMWGAEHGTNEHGVVIGNEAVWTKADDEDLATKRLLGMDLLRLGLERGRTALEALTVITTLLEEHGQGGPCAQNDPSFTYHNYFLIADPSEAWVLETAGRQWVAKKYTDGHRNISNTLTIRDDYDTCSTGLYDYAERKNLCVGSNDGRKLDWAACFGEGAVEECTSQYSRQCCGKALLETAYEGKDSMTVEDMMDILRNCDSGICMHGGFETTASMVSELIRVSSSNERHKHWMMDTPHPCKSQYSIQEVVLAESKPTETQKAKRHSSSKGAHHLWQAAVLFLSCVFLLSTVAESTDTQDSAGGNPLRNPRNRVPRFMVDYFDWHREQLQLLHEGTIEWESQQSESVYSNTTNPVGRYLILRCTEADRCGGTSDRIRSFPYFIFLAWRSKRLLFFRWERPFRIEEFMVPTPIWNWTVPDKLMHIVRKEQTNLKSSRQNFNKGNWRSFYFDGLAHERLKQVVQLPIVSLVEGNDFSGGSDHYERLMKLERMRSEEQEGLDAFKVERGESTTTGVVPTETTIATVSGGDPVGSFNATLSDEQYPNFYHDLFHTTFQPSEGVKKALRKSIRILTQSGTNKSMDYIVAHYRATYPGEPFREKNDLAALREIILHAVDCAHTISTGLQVEEGETIPIYVASDAALALETVSHVYQNQTYVHNDDQYNANIGSIGDNKYRHTSAQANRSVWTSIDIHRFSSDFRHQLSDQTKSAAKERRTVQPPAEDAPHLNFAKKDDPSGFYSIFVDIFLMSHAYCVTYGGGAGLFGVFGRLISKSPECNVPHTHPGGKLASCHSYHR